MSCLACELEALVNGQQYKRLCDRKYTRIEKRWDLSKMEIDVLSFLDLHQEYNTARDIYRTQYFSKAHVSKAIDGLTRKQYLVCYPSQNDRRCMCLRISASAQPVLADIRSTTHEIYTILFSGLTPEDRAVLLRLCRQMADNMNRALEECSM